MSRENFPNDVVYRVNRDCLTEEEALVSVREAMPGYGVKTCITKSKEYYEFHCTRKSEKDVAEVKERKTRKKKETPKVDDCPFDVPEEDGDVDLDGEDEVVV